MTVAKKNMTRMSEDFFFMSHLKGNSRYFRSYDGLSALITNFCCCCITL